MKKLYAGVAALALSCTGAHANIIFTLGNHPQPDEQNILFQSSETGTTITGQVDHTGVPVVFNTLTGQTLFQGPQGQADITCAAGCIDNGGSMSSQLNSIEMRSPGFAYTDAIINLNNGTGSAHVVVSDNLGNVFNYDLGNGQNFLTMVAEPGSGEFITDIKVTMNDAGGWNDFQQPRVSGLCELVSPTSCNLVPPPPPPPPPGVPEPASLVLLGTGLLGIGMVRRKR